MFGGAADDFRELNRKFRAEKFSVSGILTPRYGALSFVRQLEFRCGPRAVAPLRSVFFFYL